MTAIVVDSNVCMIAVFRGTLWGLFSQRWDEWITRGIHFFAPRLWMNEITSAIHKVFMLGETDEEGARNALSAVMGLGVEIENEDLELCLSAFEWATRLKQLPAYDSFYLALAERLNTEFWTADERLANRAHQLGASWVHWVGEEK